MAVKNYFGICHSREEWQKFIGWVKKTHPKAPFGAMRDLFSHWKEGVKGGIYQ